MVGLWRRQWRSSKTGRTIGFSPNRSARPIDADLDMARNSPRPSTVTTSISKALRWMMPEGNSMGPPMRSIAREQEEFFPSDDH